MPLINFVYRGIKFDRNDAVRMDCVPRVHELVSGYLIPSSNNNHVYQVNQVIHTASADATVVIQQVRGYLEDYTEGQQAFGKPSKKE